MDSNVYLEMFVWSFKLFKPKMCRIGDSLMKAIQCNRAHVYLIWTSFVIMNIIFFSCWELGISNSFDWIDDCRCHSLVLCEHTHKCQRSPHRASRIDDWRLHTICRCALESIAIYFIYKSNKIFAARIHTQCAVIWLRSAHFHNHNNNNTRFDPLGHSIWPRTVQFACEIRKAYSKCHRQWF